MRLHKAELGERKRWRFQTDLQSLIRTRSSVWNVDCFEAFGGPAIDETYMSEGKTEDEATVARANSRRPRIRRLVTRGTTLKLAGATLIIGGLAYVLWFHPVRAHSYRVARTEVVREVYGRGTVESQREAQLGFDLVGRLRHVLVDEGDTVTLGQELAGLETNQLDADVSVARSTVSVSRATLSRLRAEEKKAREALAYARVEEERARKLLPSGAIASERVDAAEQTTRTARAELDQVLAARKEATRAIGVSSGGVAQKRATVLRADLLAPFDGLIVRRLKEPGDTVAIGTTVLRLVDTSELIVRAWVDETTLHELSEGQPVRVQLAGQPLGAQLGKVLEIGREVDRQTHELLIETTLPQTPAHVAVGQRADVRIEVKRKSDVVAIPLAFLQRDGVDTFCFVDQDGRVERAKVEVGLTGSRLVEIVDGLRPGDQVLRAPQPGARLALGKRWKLAK